MNRIIPILLTSVLFTAAACDRQPTMTIGNHTLTIETAKTDTERTLGLSNRDDMPGNHGMLFIFSKPDKYGFWMKDMDFDLDFIWIRDGKVIGITSKISKDSTEIYKPQESVDSVLEVNAGWSAKNGIKIGDTAIVD